jgi:spermidine synthase
MPLVYLLFFISGCPALIYQIVWQRALFAIYGTNIQSVTIVVSAFMLGLGLGSLLGGQISRIERLPTLLLFGCVELCIGAYGLGSLRIFHFVGTHTAALPLFAVGALAFVLVLLPTMLMGGTLPFLVAYFVRLSRNVGAAVGMLYFVNTLGSAFACFLCALYTMRLLGESGSVRLAAALNIIVGLAALFAGWRSRRITPAAEACVDDRVAAPGSLLPFPLAMMLVGFSGFLSLCYELLWYRACAFATATRANAFAILLGAYLEGIAFGSLFSKGVCSRNGAKANSHLRLLSILLASASTLSFLVVPVVARLWQGAPFAVVMPIVLVAAGLMGMMFP